jgi:hypothetical protein
MDFVAASLMKASFWVILCPIDYMKRVRDSVSEMAAKLAEQDGMEFWTSLATSSNSF